MKKIIPLLLLLVTATAIKAQTFPVNNLTVSGTASFSGATTFSVLPTAPMATLGTNSTQLATTSFVSAHESCPSILDNGGDASGTADNTAALTTTLALGPSTNKCAFFPKGRYKFLSQQIIEVAANSYSSVSLLGEGSERSVLTWPTGPGIKIDLNSQFNVVHMHGMTLTTGGMNSGSGILINQVTTPIPNAANSPLSELTDVTLRGDDGAGNFDYWTAGIEIANQSNVNFNNIFVTGTNTFQGIGLFIHGTVGDPPNIFNVAGSTFNFLNVGIDYGDYVQGLTVSQSNFTGDNVGIRTVAGLHILVQLSVNNSQFNCFNTAISLATEIPDTTINGNLFLIPGPSSGIAVGINMIRSSRYAIVGNSFTGYNFTTNTNAVVMGTATSAGTVVGNSFNAVGFGVVLQAPSSGNNVQANAYSGVGTTVSNAGAGNSVGVATQ